MTDDYIIVNVESAPGLISNLRDALLEDRIPEMNARFVFRGQGDSNWGLVPSAYRRGTILGYENREFSRVAAESPKPTWDPGRG